MAPLYHFQECVVYSGEVNIQHSDYSVLVVIAATPPDPLS